MKSKNPSMPTSWEPIEKWYSQIVGGDGHYYHRKIIIPGVLRLMENPTSILDLACGTGVLARYIPERIDYTGVDTAPSFIKTAKSLDQSPSHQYLIGDITKPLKLKKNDYSHATIILALQNLEHPVEAFKNAQRNLKENGRLIIVLNHPCFRIPRQTFWEIDQAKKIQYRRIDRYLSDLKIPIQTHPGKGEKSESTFSFHHPLSSYVQWLNEAGFVVENLEEWCSDKVSIGKAAKMENRSRAEFPLFLTIKAKRA